MQAVVTLQRGIKVDLAQRLSGLVNGKVHNVSLRPRSFGDQEPHNHKSKLFWVNVVTKQFSDYNMGE